MSPASGRGLFIDLDGTLAHSIGVLRNAYGGFMEMHGQRGTDEEFDELNGPPLAWVVVKLQERYGIAGDPAVLLDEYYDGLAELYEKVEASPGAERLLTEAKSRGWRTALVTSTRGAFARRWLELRGLTSRFDCVVGGDEVSAGKPDPAPYLKALQLTECDAARSLAFEDSPSGVRSALAAGIPTLCLGHAKVDPRAEHIARLDEAIAFL